MRVQWFQCTAGELLRVGIMLGIVWPASAWATDPVFSPEVVPMPPLAPMPLSFRGALDASLDNNPNVKLYKERIAAARGHVMTQLGAMLPQLSGTTRQS